MIINNNNMTPDESLKQLFLPRRHCYYNNNIITISLPTYYGARKTLKRAKLRVAVRSTFTAKTTNGRYNEL